MTRDGSLSDRVLAYLEVSSAGGAYVALGTLCDALGVDSYTKRQCLLISLRRLASWGLVEKCGSRLALSYRLAADFEAKLAALEAKRTEQTTRASMAAREKLLARRQVA